MSAREVTIESLSRKVEALEARLAAMESRRPGRLLSVKEAALLLGIKPDTLRRWVQNNKITFERIGNHPKFELRTIEAFRARSREHALPQLLRSRKAV